MSTGQYQPWNEGVRGTQVLPLINSDAARIRVEAGPGTGKTFGLVRRLQRILDPGGLGVPGEEVLVVAFNRVIAQQLAEDIGKMLNGAPHTSKPVIRTIHALCLDYIGKDVRLLLPHEEEAMLYDALRDNPDLVAIYPRFNDAAQALRDHEANHAEHTKLWQACERWRLRHHCALISDLPGLLLASLRGGDHADRKFRHIVVDEFQDLTPGEQQLIVRLLQPGGSITALGDPRQSIYKFRGNDREGLAKLATILGVDEAEISDVPMTECQRCPETVVNAANRLMNLYGSAPMVATSNVASNIHVVHWDTPQAEAVGMAAAVVANMKANPGARHLAMVTRKDFGYALRDAITSIDPAVSVQTSFSEGLLETWAVREAFLTFCLLADPDPATWRAWLGYRSSSNGLEWKSPKRNADAYLNLFGANADTISEKAIQSLIDNPKSLAGSGRSNVVDRAKRYMELKASFAQDPGSAAAFIASVFDPKKWVTKAMLDGQAAGADMLLLSKLAETLLPEPPEDGTTADREETLRKVARALRYHIAIRETALPDDEGATLKITTFWSAKGVTAEHVYIIGLCEQAIPGERKEEYPGTDDDYREEQRRLFYVSITRSKSTLVLSRPKAIARGEAAQMGFKDDGRAGYQMSLLMAPFLRDIIDYLPDSVDGKAWKGCAA